MSVGDQFTVYQMKQTQETRQMCFRPFEVLKAKGIRVCVDDYDKVYTGSLYPEDTPETVRERLEGQHFRSFLKHSVSISDVLVIDRPGGAATYYVEKDGFTLIEDFFKNESSSSGTPVSIDTVNFHIEGKAGSWLAFDSIRLAGQEFFLMEHETYGKEAAWVVVDGAGRLAVDNVRNGFDREVKRKLEKYLYPKQPEEKKTGEIRQQTDSAGEEKPPKHQKGDGAEKPRKKPKGRQSVLEKLHKKQAEIAQRSAKKGRQDAVENDTEREQK